MTSPGVDRPSASVDLVLAELRRAVDVGFSRIDGQLALYLQRADHSDTAVDALRTEVRALHVEVEELKRARFPLPTIGVLTALAALAVTVYQLVAH
ncbi:hypothetical protein ACFVGM_08610 [Kitasatospora purpeofusca]|uniref:hypothetical protein n=1 Tax=Kitasatospora purpeofusca TaxID=67352 RepID=UPI00367BA13E